MKNLNLKIKRNGFTLIELLIGIALAGIVGVLVAAIFLANSRLFSDQQTSILVADQNNIALAEIVAQTRQGQKVVNECDGCGADVTGPNTLIVRAWPQDPAGNPVQPASCVYDYIIYKKDSGKLLKTVIITDPAISSRKPLSNKVIATNVEELEFHYDDDLNPAGTSEVKTSVTTKASTIFGKPHSFSQEAKAVLRNR